MSELGRWCFRNRRRVLVAWVAALFLLGLASQIFGGAFRNDFRVTDSESQRALDLLQERFPEYSGDPLALVFQAEATVDDPAVRQRMEALFAEMQGLDGVEEVVSPYTGLAPVNADRTTAIAQVRLAEFGPEVDPELVRGIIERTEELSRQPGLQVDVGGPTAMFAELEPPGEREGAGIVVALGVLVLTFGSVVAAGLPIAVALGGLGAGMAVVLLMTRVMEVFTFAPAMAAMIGLGVGIDYALFIVTRHRQEIHDGADPEDAAAIAIGTSGRAVVFAGATVIISLLGMVLMGVSMVVGMAISAAVVVAATVLAAITLLPAVLGYAGASIDRLTVRRPREVDDPTQGRWYRWSRTVQSHPWPALLAALVVLVGLAVPVASMELGGPHFGAGPESQSSRRAYDAVTTGFGEGFNGPLVLVAEMTPGDPSERAVVDDLVERIRVTEGVALVAPAMTNEVGDTGVVLVVPTSGPHTVETQELVERLREDVVPAVPGAEAMTVSVSGVTALFADMAQLFNRRLPVFIAVVIALSFLLLMVVFRSLLVPLKAALMNLLSIGAAYGVVVAVFQWGWGASLLGVDRPGPIMAFVPMMLFAILFGLSMDYEVFLLSRMREEYDRSGDNATAVADGLAATARVITAAAAIMVIIFGSFVLGDDPIIKTFGLGLAVAVFVDATVVRMVLVPATMELLGDANWWLPSWLDRLLPTLDLEGSAVAPRAADPLHDPAGASMAPVRLTGDVATWLESLNADQRGSALAHVERALANGRCDAAHASVVGEVIVPLGRRTRTLTLGTVDDGHVLDVRSGRVDANHVDWEDLRRRMLQDEAVQHAYRAGHASAEVAVRVRSLREARDMSVDDLARAASTSVDVIERLEAGDSSIAVIDAIRVALVLDVWIDMASGSEDDRGLQTASGTAR